MIVFVSRNTRVPSQCVPDAARGWGCSLSLATCRRRRLTLVTSEGRAIIMSVGVMTSDQAQEPHT